MRITVLASSYPRFPGDGTAPFVKSIAENMVKLGHEIEVVAPYDEEVDLSIVSNIRVHRFRYAWPDHMHIMGHARALEADVRLRSLSYLLLPLYLLAAFLKLLTVANRQNSQAIHVHWVLPNGPVAVVVASLLRIPYFVSLHGSDIFIAKKHKVFGYIARWVFKHASGVTACSQELKSGALSLGASEDIELIAWGADPEFFNPKKRTQDFWQKWDIDIDSIVVIALGRLVHKKGFDKLISAWSLIADRHPKAHLVIGGDGLLKENLALQSRNLGVENQITYTGRVPWDQVPEFLSSGDIFVLPSIRDEHIDGLPTVLLEAMACQLPPIASDIGGVPLVVDEGKNGCIVPPGDIKALADALDLVISNENIRNQLGQAARDSVCNIYNWENVARKILKMIDVAVWQRTQQTRMGSIYRDELIQLLDKRPVKGRVLDVGCHDGYFLSTLKSEYKIGIDPEPSSNPPNACMIKADGCDLPFADQTFDHVFALDVIEHIADDYRFAKSLSRLLTPDGRIFLTTPSVNIRMIPAFLTNWISNKWGHYLRLGYSMEDLEALFDQEDLIINISTWNAPAYRLLYLPVRLIFPIFPNGIAKIVRGMARWDFRHPEGEHGYVLIEVLKSQIPE
jgi:glycosyltransferase involved in cell wall biosynthesis